MQLDFWNRALKLERNTKSAQSDRHKVRSRTLGLLSKIINATATLSPRKRFCQECRIITMLHICYYY